MGWLSFSSLNSEGVQVDSFKERGLGTTQRIRADLCCKDTFSPKIFNQQKPYCRGRVGPGAMPGLRTNSDIVW